jgi:hypothetical protein
VIYVAIVLCTSTPFLLLAGARISARIQARREDQ